MQNDRTDHHCIDPVDLYVPHDLLSRKHKIEETVKCPQDWERMEEEADCECSNNMAYLPGRFDWQEDKDTIGLQAD